MSASISARSAPSDPPAAEALFRAGRSAFDRGDYADALRRFSESYQLEPAVGTLLNVASTEERLGKLAQHGLQPGQGGAVQGASIQGLLVVTGRWNGVGRIGNELRCGSQERDVGRDGDLH